MKTITSFIESVKEGQKLLCSSVPYVTPIQPNVTPNPIRDHEKEPLLMFATERESDSGSIIGLSLSVIALTHTHTHTHTHT